MFSKLKLRIKSNPPLFYAMSVAATWAGAGSFIVGTQIAKENGIFPWLLWALGNTLTCIVFGLLPKAPRGCKQQTRKDSYGIDVCVPDLGQYERDL